MKEQQLNFDGVEKESLKDFAERAYLDYSMYVILDRALPHLGDGLKPVQRRIVYAMSELGLAAGAKHKKSARTVGDVIGKFHPHGDSACYEAMVHMAQDFAYRYPIVDGQGNWGSTDDPKSFAQCDTPSRGSPGMRRCCSRNWVRARSTGFRTSTVRWRSRPCCRPGAEFAAQRRLRDSRRHGDRHSAAQPARSGEGLRGAARRSGSQHAQDHGQHQGPRSATGGEIVSPRDDLVQMYETGSGSFRARATYEIEDGQIVIDALPFQVSGAKVQEQIAAQMQQKKLPMVEDLRDESDHENPTRLVIVPKSNRVDIQALMTHLFATTDLERNYRVNLNVIAMDGRPRVMD